MPVGLPFWESQAHRRFWVSNRSRKGNVIMGWNTEGLHRRKLLLGGSIVSASLLMAGLASAGTTATPSSAVTRAQAGDVVVKGVEFKKNDGITLAGNIYYPKGFNEGQKYPTIVVVHPGASGGMPRFVDDPMKRVGDIYSAVDYLTSLPYVDAGRIGALGVCAGSGTTVKAAMTERRIKAIATVSAVDVGAATRKGWDGK